MTAKTICPVPSIRVRKLNQWPIDPSRQFVLYWMTAYRRTTSNFALQRGVELANQLNKPLVVFEAIRVNYRWASDRIHQFILEGMIDNAASMLAVNATYCAYVETSANEGKGLLEALATCANVIVSDDYPCFFHS